MSRKLTDVCQMIPLNGENSTYMKFVSYKHRFLNKHLRTVAVTTPPFFFQYNLLYLHNNIAFTHLRQPIKTISNKEYMALIIVSAGWVYFVGANLVFALSYIGHLMNTPMHEKTKRPS